MSEYWNLRCLNCNERTDLNLDHGEETVVKMMACRTEAEALAEAVSRVRLGEGLPQWMLFFKDHPAVTHHIVGSSEYGYRSGGCRTDHPDRLGVLICSLPDKHPGDHVWRDRWTY